MKLCKKKTNEKLTNCKLLLCIWILNKKTNLNSTNNFKFSNTHLNAGPIQQQICKNIDSLFVWMRFSLWFRVSLSLHSAGKQHVVGRPLSIYLSLSLHCSPISNMCMQRALSSSLAQHHSWSPLSPSSTSLIVIVIVIKLISSARTTTRTATTEMAKQISSMHSHTHTHMHTYIHSHIHTPRWHATEILEKQQLILRKCIKNTHHE